MTTHRPHQTPNTHPLPNPGPETFTPDRGDSPGGTVPVIVWRIAPAPGNDSGLPGRLAHHLVAIYTSAGETIADVDTDDSVRDAAAAGARHYLRINATELASYQPKPGQPITLIMIRWPQPVPVPDIRTLLAACKDILGPGGSIIVAVTAAAAGYPGTTYAEHERQLLPSAKTAGLRHLHDIVALTATGGRDIFSYATAPAQLSTEGRDSGTDTPCHGTATTLIILGKMAVRP